MQKHPDTVLTYLIMAPGTCLPMMLYAILRWPNLETISVLVVPLPEGEPGDPGVPSTSPPLLPSIAWKSGRPCPPAGDAAADQSRVRFERYVSSCNQLCLPRVHFQPALLSARSSLVGGQ